MAKEILFKDEARNKLKKGIDLVADSVKTTLGYGGKNVWISNNLFQVPISTKDGVTVAESIFLKDPQENAGALIIKSVAKKTAVISGDGTTSSTILAQEIITEGMKNIVAGANPAQLKKGIEKATAHVVKKLKDISLNIGDDNIKIKHVATVSTNGDDEIGGLIAEAFGKIGNGAHIVMEESRDEKTTMKYQEGYQFDRGWTSPFWVTEPQKMISELKNPYILLFDGKISSWDDTLKILNEMMAAKKRDILIVAEDVEGQSRDTFITNKVNGVVNVVCVISPAFGERRTQMMEDIAILTNGTFISVRSGHKLKECGISMLGTCERVVVTKDTTTIIGGAGSKEKVEERVAQITSLIEQSESDLEVEQLSQRISKLTGQIAVLSVGAPTEIEMKEKKYRVEDAIRATNSAIEEGIVPGGGTALVRCVSSLYEVQCDTQDERTGVSIIAKAIGGPLKMIATNVSKNGDTIYDKVFEQYGNYGYNAKTDQIEDLIESGIIDPTKVVRVALENASSVAAMVLISECFICETDVAK